MTTTIGSLDLGALSDLREDVTQYFWFESNSSSAWGSGAHITLYPESQFTDPNNANYLKGQNILMNTDGLSIRNGALPMMVLDNDSLDFNIVDTTNNTYTNRASFGAVSTIGVTNNTQSYMQLDYHSLQMVDKEGDTYFYVSDLRDASGKYLVTGLTFTGDGTTVTFNLSLPSTDTNYIVSVSDSSGGNITKYTGRVVFSSAPTNGAIITIGDYYTTSTKAKAYTFGSRSDNNLGGMSCVIGVNNKAFGYISYAEGYYTTASGNYSHAEGYRTTASGNYSHAEGDYATASGDYSHAEGYLTTASGQISHAEGNYTTASGNYSHAEGYYTTASGNSSHAEGNYTTASGQISHAEGFRTTASGIYSHAGGFRTTATENAQTVIGTYNIPENSPTSETTHPSGGNFGNYALIIGNGDIDQSNSNALTVDWQGGVAFYDPSRTFVVESVEIATERLASGANGQYNVTAQKEGYYPIGVVGFLCVNGGLAARRMYIDTRAIGSCNAVVNVRNVGSSAAAASTVTLDILWVKAT